jgi:tyrosyl-tRNA synthetase
MPERAFKNSLLSELNERGFLYQHTDKEGLDEQFKKGKVTFYIGFDPTAKSLHAGHLLWITLVNKLQRAGHRPIVIVGGSTSIIGDPTWKDSQRVMLTQADVLENAESIMHKLRVCIDFDGDSNSAILLNNSDWISEIKYLDFLSKYGMHFSVNRMLTMDSVSERLKRQQHLSFLEFNYMVLQAFDFLHLYKSEGCTLQIGGADQWSNIISGVDLIRKIEGNSAFGLTFPLLTNPDGKKMGKTERGTVWLDERLTSPFEFWQYWRSVDDKNVSKLLKLFTDLSIEEIESYNEHIGSPEINEAKVILADAVTSFVHPTADIPSIKTSASSALMGIASTAEHIETFVITRGTGVDKALVDTGLAKSLSEARRLIEGKGVKIDGVTVDSIKSTIDNECLISTGKKNFAKINVE